MFKYQTISEIKCCGLRGVPGKASNFKHQNQVSNTQTEILTILALIHEAEGPENMRMKMLGLKAPKDQARSHNEANEAVASPKISKNNLPQMKNS